MKPRLKFSLRFATDADATSAMTRLATQLAGRTEFDRPRLPGKFFDEELNAWVVYGDIRYPGLTDRDAVKDAISNSMNSGPGSGRVLSGSYVSFHASHHDEGVGGDFDRPVVTLVKP